MNKAAYIIFTRIPCASRTKTRLQAKFNAQEASEIQYYLILDLFQEMKALLLEGIDIFVAYSDETNPETFLEILPEGFQNFPQQGENIGIRMSHAFQQVADLGYEKIVLTGSDIPQLSRDLIQRALEELKEIIIGPSVDGGYYLIGCRSEIGLKGVLANEIKWGTSEVLSQSLNLIGDYSVVLLPRLQDIDYPEDLEKLSDIFDEKNKNLQNYLKKVKK